MKLEMVCIQLCQGAVSVGCTDKPYIVDSVPDHMVVVAFQKLAAFIPVVVQEPSIHSSPSTFQFPLSTIPFSKSIPLYCSHRIALTTRHGSPSVAHSH